MKYWRSYKSNIKVDLSVGCKIMCVFGVFSNIWICNYMRSRSVWAIWLRHRSSNIIIIDEQFTWNMSQCLWQLSVTDTGMISRITSHSHTNTYVDTIVSLASLVLKMQSAMRSNRIKAEKIAAWIDVVYEYIYCGITLMAIDSICLWFSRPHNNYDRFSSLCVHVHMCKPPFSSLDMQKHEKEMEKKWNNREPDKQPNRPTSELCTVPQYTPHTHTPISISF